MILNLLYICLIVALVFESGFWDALDGYIGEWFGLGYHLPHIFMCALCQCFWLSLLYVILSGNISLFNVVLCLINAHMVNVMIPLFKTVQNIIMKIIELINKIC